MINSHIPLNYGYSETPSHNRSVECLTSDDIKEKIINLARKEFLNNYGMTDGEELSSLTRKYVLSLPEKERSSAAWTLGQMFSNESARLHDVVKSNNPVGRADSLLTAVF